MDKVTIRRLFRQHYAKMYRVAMTILYDEEESKDVVSDIFVCLFRESMVLLPESEERYLLASVRNRCFKRMRHEEVKRKMMDNYAPELDEEKDDERLTDIIEYVVSHLSTQDQRIFKFRFSDGYSYEEIALVEGISKVAVWKHISNIIKRIKEHFKTE